MKTTDKAVAVSPQTTRTKYDAVLLTIRSRKSFFEVTQAIESSMQRFHTPKLMEYVTHGNRAGVEAYVDSTSKPMAIFWDFEQGSTMRLEVLKGRGGETLAAQGVADDQQAKPSDRADGIKTRKPNPKMQA